MDDGVKEFFATHVAGGSGHVVMVTLVNPGGPDDGVSYVFSSIDKAQVWGNSLGDEYIAVYSSRVVDVPEFGNVPKEAQQ